jgi:uncharacterized glyoxalase superfamily protein PhnB
MDATREQPDLPINRSMPPGVIIPELAYPDVAQAAEWLCRSFGFSQRLLIGNHRAQLTIGAGCIVVTELSAESRLSTQDRLTHALMVRVADVDGHYQRAKQACVRIIAAPADYPFGERQYTAEDFAGHRWTFSQTIADVDPKSWGGKLLK